VPDSEIAASIATADIGSAVQRLIDATLAAGAPDNVTVLIAEAYAEPTGDPLPDSRLV
jgi:serine/threonine protein phosphatase PrpC